MWISVKNELPNDGYPVLVYCHYGSHEDSLEERKKDMLTVIGYFSDGNWTDGEVWGNQPVVTHWMPLPEPPTGDD